MNAFSSAVALTLLTAIAGAFAAQTQPSSESHLAPNAAPGPYQYDAGATSGTALCHPQREAQRDTVSSTAFAATAAQDGMVEVALAALVFRKSGDNQLRQLAEKLVQDYALSNGGLDSIVKCEGLILPTELDAKHYALINRLDAKSGKAFEVAYLKHVAEQHADAAALFKAGSMSGDPELAAFARKGLLMLQEHQRLAVSLRANGTEVAKTH